MAKAHLGTANQKPFSYDVNALTQHAVVVGSTGSGKTVMCKALIEEVLMQGIPVIAIDPKGDIGSLGLVNKDFDFRPFGSARLAAGAQKIAARYKFATKPFYSASEIAALGQTKTTIYTPKSSVGKSVNLMPDLAAPKDFASLVAQDASIVAEFVDPITLSIVQLCNISNAQKDKVKSLLSAILVDSWTKGENVTIPLLIERVISPPFGSLGSLAIDDFLKESDRRKIASSINLLLTSPSMLAWGKGESLSVEKMLKKNTLSVFDLRFSGSLQDKQFAVEQILQELYRYLVRAGGSGKLRFVLYIDELVGILPPPPASPSSKKLLELLIRQARAFGLGIVLATQSPGDIDYKIIGNLGTRFVGRLRTDNDIAKIAEAMQVSPSSLSEEIASLTTGTFLYNNAVLNKSATVKSRWLYSFHEGPLTEQEISYINDASRVPAKEGSLKVVLPKEKSVKTERKIVSTKTLVKQVKKSVAAKANKSRRSFSKKEVPNYSGRPISVEHMLKVINSRADSTQLKISVDGEHPYNPHLRIVIAHKPLGGHDFGYQGPYLFDLSSKIIPLHDYLKNKSWKTITDGKIITKFPVASIDASFKFAVADAKKRYKQTMYQSLLTKHMHVSRKACEQQNSAYLMQMHRAEFDRLDHAEHKVKTKENAKIDAIKSEIRMQNLRMVSQKAARLLRKNILGHKISTNVPRADAAKKKILRLEREIERHRSLIRKTKKLIDAKRKVLSNKIFIQSHSKIKQVAYAPSDKDLSIHATLLLVGTKR